MARYIILFYGILGLLVYGGEDRKTPRKAGHEFVDPLLRAQAASPMPESEKDWEVLKEKWMGYIYPHFKISSFSRNFALDNITK